MMSQWMMDFNKAVNVAKAACVCVLGTLEHEPGREDIDKEIMTNVNVIPQ